MLRTFCVCLAGAAILAGCAGQPRSDRAEPTPRRADAGTPPPIEDSQPLRPAPSLEEEMRAQARREAAGLSRSVNIPFDAVYTSDAPAWWKPGQPGATFGRYQARSLDAAFATAARQATAAAESDSELARGGKIVRAGYARLATGDYVAWAAYARAGDPIALLPVTDAPAAPPARVSVAPAPVVLPPISVPGPVTPAPAPVSSQPDHPPPVQTADALPPAWGDLPPWWSEAPAEVGGRLTVCAAADAQTARDAQRLAVRGARTQLQRTIGGEARDLITHKQETRQVGGMFRSFVMVSAGARP